MSIFINLAVIFWSLFPSLLVYTDNQDEPLKVQLTQLVANSDLLIDDNADNIPDGFSYSNATDISLTNGIATFTASAKYGQIRPANSSIFNTLDIYYSYANFKSDSNLVGVATSTGSRVSHSGSGNFEFHSTIGVFSNVSLIGNINDSRTSDWTPIEVDYIGAINITDLVSRGLLPGGLSDL